MKRIIGYIIEFDIKGKIIRTIKCQIRSLESKISKAINKYWHERVRFKHASGRKLNYKNPKTWDEKLFWLNRYWQHPIKVKCSDKYLIHMYLKDKNLSELSVPLIGVWNDADFIEFDNLPNKFVLKANHGCGFNIICKNKDELNIKEVKRQLNEWLKIDYGKLHNEFHYSKIKPRIICENFLEMSNIKSMVDYKLHCFNGSPYLFLICRDRDTELKLSSYDTNWNRCAYLKNEDIITLPEPKQLDKMLRCAKIISDNIPYVRVDYFEIDNKLYLGELTFTPYGNTIDYYKNTTLDRFGKILNLPEKY